MKTILLLTLFCFSANAATPNTVLLISPLVQMEERDLPKEMENYQSYSEYYLNNFPKEKNIENLLNDFESAQKYYLVNSRELARQYFEKVIHYADVDEWKDVHRKIIYISHMRLAELNQENEQEWILKGLRFALEIDPSKLNLSKDMLKKISSIKKSFLNEAINWEVSKFKSDFRFILINGHQIDLRKIEVVKIPAGKFRVTFLSDVYKLQTYQVSSQQIPLLIPTRIPFVSGTCEKPFVNDEGEIQSKVAIYFSKDCIKNQNGKKWMNEKADAIKNPEYNFISSTSYGEEPFYKKKWFLVGLGIVAASAAIYMVNESRKEKPTHETVNGF